MLPRSYLRNGLRRSAGGGFSMDGGDGHLKFWSTVQEELAASNKPISFLFVAYSLAPFDTYPTQVEEGIEALNYVLNDLGRSPSDVLLAGDSAGGNLCLAILSHMMHPIPELPTVLTSQPLKALVLVAPWLSFQSTWPSMRKNAHKDLMTAEGSVRMGNDYLGGAPSSSYAEAVDAPASWWQDARVDQLLCVAGGDEILIDSIDAWVEKYKVSHILFSTTRVVSRTPENKRVADMRGEPGLTF